MATLEEFKNQLQQRQRPLTREEIEFVNDGLKEKETKVKIVTRSSDGWKTFFTIAFWILAIAIAVIAYMAYNHELDLFNVTCPAIPACPASPTCPSAPSCPSIPSCPSCTNNCNPTLKCKDLPLNQSNE